MVIWKIVAWVLVFWPLIYIIYNFSTRKVDTVKDIFEEFLLLHLVSAPILGAAVGYLIAATAGLWKGAGIGLGVLFLVFLWAILATGSDYERKLRKMG